jgi:hypothetical protein
MNETGKQSTRAAPKQAGTPKTKFLSVTTDGLERGRPQSAAQGRAAKGRAGLYKPHKEAYALHAHN